MGIGFEIGIILVLICINGIFAMAECALVSSRKTRLQMRAAQGDARAAAALDLANAPTQFLSTVQVGITLIGILAGAYGGQAPAHALATWLATFPLLQPAAQALGFGVVIVVITYLSLVIGELVPKRMALTHPERIAARMAGPMRLFARLAYPAERVLSWSTDLLARLLRIKPEAEPPVTEGEIKLMLDQATQHGVFEKAEKDIVYNVFRFAERRVSTIMTPRAEIVWLDVEKDMQENYRRIAETNHSHFPVCKDHLDDVLGMVSVKMLWAAAQQGRKPDLKEALYTPLYVPESMNALRLLEVFRKARRHLALVVDEFGTIQGVVTLHDVMEQIVGEVPGEAEPPSEMIVRREDGSWLVDGLVPVDLLKETLRLKDLPGEGRGAYHTSGGLMMFALGRIPRTADRFEWQNHRFEVMDMDGNRVDKLMITPQTKPGGAATD